MRLRSRRFSRLVPAFLMVATGFIAIGHTASAQCPEEPVLQYWTGAGSVTCPCFVSGEEAGVVFTAPAQHYPLEILRVQIGWGSVFGGAPDSLENAIKIYPAGLPNPGTPQFQLSGPVLTDGFVNEFDLELVPGNKIINSGPFTVSLEFLNQSPAARSERGPRRQRLPGRQERRGRDSRGLVRRVCARGVSGDWLFGVVYRPVNCCNDQAFWTLYGNGFPGKNGIPTISSERRTPRFGETITVSISNSRGSFTVGLLLTGFTPLNLIGAWGGELLVDPTWITLVPLLGSGANLTGDIPNDPSLCGLSLYVQMLESDPFAAAGLSSTPGLELHIGE